MRRIFPIQPAVRSLRIFMITVDPFSGQPLFQRLRTTSYPFPAPIWSCHLQALVWAREHGYQRCAADWEPMNSVANRFWTGRFDVIG